MRRKTPPKINGNVCACCRRARSWSVWPTLISRYTTFARASGANPLQDIAKDAEQLIAFQRGHRIAAGLAELWQTQGHYRNARTTLDSALAEDQLLSGGNDLRGIHVMTVHKAKGKEFDAVIIFDDPYSSPLLFSQEDAPHPRCRKLLRVGITRARHHVLMLTDLYSPSALLNGHKL